MCSNDSFAHACVLHGERMELPYTEFYSPWELLSEFKGQGLFYNLKTRSALILWLPGSIWLATVAWRMLGSVDVCSDPPEYSRLDAWVQDKADLYTLLATFPNQLTSGSQLTI